MTDAEFWAVHANWPPMQQIGMELAWLTGLRREDIVNLTRDSVTDEGLLVHTGKTDKPLLFVWTDELRELIDRAQAMPPRVRRHLLCNRQAAGTRRTGSQLFGPERAGKRYRTALWQRLTASTISGPSQPATRQTPW